MDKKEVLVYFSDCPFFAGCENMIPNFLNSKEINNSYEVYFLYRKSDAYSTELKNRLLNSNLNCIALNLPNYNIHKSLLSGIKNIPILYKLFAALIIFVMKYFTIINCTPLLYKKFNKLNTDILHINNGGYPAAFTAYSAVIAARLIGVNKIIYVVNNIAQNYTSPLRWFDKMIDIYVRRKVSKFVTGSINAGEKLKSILKLSRNKVVNIPNGVKLREITLSRLELLKDLELDLKNRPLFSTIALLEERKGHIWLLKAIKKLKESNIDSDASPFFIFEGNGSTFSILNNYISKNKLENYVTIIKEIPNIFNLINASDAIILPSIFMEDFPNVIIEAMSLGKPVIGTKIAGIPEQIDHHKNGCLVKPKDSGALYDSIIHLMNKDVRETYGIQSKHKYNENYKVEISINKYIQLYKSKNK
jgi:L-malate glycosyltransferase